MTITSLDLWTYNLKKRQTSITDVHRKWLIGILKDRKCANVRLSKHFVDRMVERRIDPEKVFKAVHDLADRLCEITYQFEAGFIPYITVGNMWMKLAYYNQIIYIQTCYEKPQK